MNVSYSGQSPMMPPWEEVRDNYIARGLPGRFVLRVSPSALFFVDEGATRIGGRFRIEGNTRAPSSPLNAISVNTVRISDEMFIEISTTVDALYRNFYLLFADVASDVLDGGSDVKTALANNLTRWRSLLSEASALSFEQQIGLFGELYVLHRVIAARGAGAVESWTGPERQSHDFRLGDVEIEVKATGGARHTHKINGLNQLRPSPGARLYIISLRLEFGGGAGLTLPELVHVIRSSLNGVGIDRFESSLVTWGYSDENAASYARRYKLADSPTLIPVTDGCPRLTPELFESLPSSFAAQRIGTVTYEVDLTELGYIDGRPEFVSILPQAPSPIGV